MATYILMRNGTINQEVRSDDVERWKAYGYEVADDPSLSSAGKEVAGETPVSPVASTVTPKKRTTTRKKGAQKDDQS